MQFLNLIGSQDTFTETNKGQSQNIYQIWKTIFKIKNKIFQIVIFFGNQILKTIIINLNKIIIESTNIIFFSDLQNIFLDLATIIPRFANLFGIAK